MGTTRYASSSVTTMKNKKDLLQACSYGFLREFALEARLLQNNGTYQDKKDHVRGLVRRLSKPECEFLHEQYHADRTATDTADSFVRRYRPDEEVLRTEFLSYLDSQRSPEDVVFCELPLGGNRTDVNRIDDRSVTYELKSPRDTFDRLTDQVSTYQRAFEQTYLVTSAKRSLPESLPDGIGVIEYVYPEFEFKVVQEASTSDRLDPDFQLNQLWQSELRACARDVDPTVTSTIESKPELIAELQQSLSGPQINSMFKQQIRSRTSKASV